MLGKVLILAKSFTASEGPLKYLTDQGCEVVIKSTPVPFDENWLLEQVGEVDAIIFAMEPTTAKVIDAAKKLKVIARPGVGYDTVDLAAASRRKIPVTIQAGTNDQSVADFAIGLMLMAARKMVVAVNSVQSHGWERPTGTEMWGKTVAIFGLGRIGKGVARRALGFDMKVLAVDAWRDQAFATKHGIEFVDMERALREADFVSLHTPLTPETENFINERTLALMKPTAFLINTARGGLIDENALAAAVKEGRLAGAAVDVLRQQGANSPSPLIGVPGIIVTPHMAPLAHEAMERVSFSAAKSVVAALNGERPANVVNLEIYNCS